MSNTAMQPGDDPAEFKVGEVKEFLAGEVDPAEAERVREAEEQGKARASVLAAAEDGVVLFVAGPLNTTSVQFETEDGTTLVIDTLGTRVPADEADDLVFRAALAGVSLNRKDN